MDSLTIIGAGPGGLGAAIAAAELGVKPVVYEAHARLAVKPCSHGVPIVGEMPFRVPKESILREIRGAVMYVNGEFLFELRDSFSGYIVDKERMIRLLLEEAGAELLLGSKYHVGSNRLTLRRGEFTPRHGIFAGGHVYYTGEKIGVIQYILRSREFDDSRMLEIYFDTELLGYYFVFPSAPGEVEVGVGGFKQHHELRRRLESFIGRDPRLSESEVVRREGAMVAVGGVRLGRLNGLVIVGEAAGYVFPLTGEGIRPSIISGYIAARALIKGRDPIGELARLSLTKAINRQKAILEWVKTLEPHERAELLRSLPPKVHIELSLGTMRPGVMLPEIIKNLSKPGRTLKILSVMAPLFRRYVT